MSRSPWRDALDGQLRVLRELRKPVAAIHLGVYADTPSIQQRFPNPGHRAQFQYTYGETLAEGIEKLVRDAEPVYLSSDIDDAVRKKIDHIVEVQQQDRATVPPDPPVFDIEKYPLQADMLPIQQGLIWFHGTSLSLRDIPTKGFPPSLQYPDTEGPVYIRAVYFGDEPAMVIKEHIRNPGQYLTECRTRDRDDPMKGMGIVVFLDANKSGFSHMTREFGDHLVPVLLGYWEFGLVLDEFIQASGPEYFDRTPGINTQGTTAMAAVVGTYLFELFRLMLNRITLWGGVGLDRTEQEQAQRDKLRPRVQLVTWRKAHYQYPEGHIPVPVSWSCRWEVRPHFRRYKSGKVVQINSYVKGPVDKPFREQAIRAHQVKR